MREVRLTFNADDFGTISKMLVEMGVGFSVEPVGEAEEKSEVAAPREAPAPAAPKRKTAKKKAKATGKRPGKRSGSPILGADRLREALTRKPAEPAGGATGLPDSWPETGTAGGSTPAGD